MCVITAADEAVKTAESKIKFDFTQGWWMKKIQMEKVWEKGIFGSSNVVTAVLDSGINHSHPDLAGSIWKSSEQLKLDIFGKKVVCEPGDWGFDAENLHCRPGNDGRHGTGIAGVIGAINRRASIISVRVLADASPAGLSGRVEHLIRGIEFVIQLKAVYKMADVRVINCSLGFDKSVAGVGDKLKALNDAVERANAAGILMVCAAGNCCGDNIKEKPFYPASLDAENIISVSAVYDNDEVTATSSVGADIAAPGIGIYTTVGNGYDYLHQTSIAAAFVTGAAALIHSQFPDLSPKKMRELILQNADSLNRDIPPFGRLNIYRALTEF